MVLIIGIIGQTNIGVQNGTLRNTEIASLISLDDGVWMLDIEFETAWNPPVEAIEHFVKARQRNY